MYCQEFEARLHELLDDRQCPEVDGQLRAHAAQCSACHQLLELQSLLFTHLPATPQPRATDGNHATGPAINVARDALAINTPTNNKRVPYKQDCDAGHRRRRPWPSHVAVAAVLVVCLWALRSLSPFGAPSTPPHPTTPSQASPSSGTIVTAPQRPTSSPVLASTASQGIAGSQGISGAPHASATDMAAATTGGPWIAAENQHFAGIVSIDRLTSATVEDLLFEARQSTEWNELSATFTRPFRPVANSVVTALDVIRKTLPGKPGHAADPPQARRLPTSIDDRPHLG